MSPPASAPRRNPAPTRHRTSRSGAAARPRTTARSASPRRSPPRRGGSSRGQQRSRAVRGSRPWYHPLAHSDGVYLGLLLILLVGVGLIASGPYADYTVATDRVAGLGHTQADLTRSVDELASEEARLQDPEALEELARGQLGLVRPGEIPYIVVNPPTEDPTHLSGIVEPQPAGDPRTTQEPRSSWFVRLVDAVRGFFR